MSTTAKIKVEKVFLLQAPGRRVASLATVPDIRGKDHDFAAYIDATYGDMPFGETRVCGGGPLSITRLPIIGDLYVGDEWRVTRGAHE